MHIMPNEILYASPVGWLFICAVLSLSTHFSKPLKKLRVRKVHLESGQWAREIKSTLINFLGDIFFSCLVIWTFSVKFNYAFEFLPDLTFALLMLCWFEIWFYFSHKKLHGPTLYKLLHHQHHDSITTTPFTAFRFSLIERIFVTDFGVLLPAVVVNFVCPVPIYSFILFVNALYFFDIYGHSNIDVQFKIMNRIWPFSEMSSARIHTDHHEFPAGNFGFIFIFLDRLMGTEVTERNRNNGPSVNETLRIAADESEI